MAMESSFRELFDDQESAGEIVSSDRLREDAEKWSLKGDLNLLCTLENFSQDLSAKSETMQKSLDQITFDSKMKAVKVKNLINDFQMLENCQFIENRVYDEEIDDGIVNGTSSSNEEVTKSEDPESVKKNIRKSLDAGLHFIDRTLNGSRQVNEVSFDSEEEEDCLYANLAAMFKENRFNRVPLPHIVGSELFMKDNFFVTSPDSSNDNVDESVVRKSADEQKDDGEYFSDESSFDQETFAKPIENHVEESKDNGIFMNNNEEDDDDFLFVPKRKASVISSKPTVTEDSVASDEAAAFDDNVSAVDSKHVNQSNDEMEKTNTVSQLRKNLKLENIFAGVVPPVPKTTKDEISEEEDDDNDIFTRKVIPVRKPSLHDVQSKTTEETSQKSLFVDDGDEDLFSAIKPSTSKPTSEKQTVKNKLSFLSDDDEIFSNKPVIKTTKNKPQVKDKSVVSQENHVEPTSVKMNARDTDNKKANDFKSKNSLFDDIDNDDLFSQPISKKTSKPVPHIKEDTKSSKNKTSMPQSTRTADATVKSITNAFVDLSDESDDDLFGKLPKNSSKVNRVADALFSNSVSTESERKAEPPPAASLLNTSIKKEEIEVDSNSRDEEYNSDQSSSGDELYTTGSTGEATKDEDLFSKDEEELFTPRHKSKLQNNTMYTEETSAFESKVSIRKSNEKSLSSSDVSPVSAKNEGSSVSALKKSLNLEDIFAKMAPGAKMPAKKPPFMAVDDDEDDDEDEEEDIFSQPSKNKRPVIAPQLAAEPSIKAQPKSDSLFGHNDADELFSKSSSSSKTVVSSYSTDTVETKPVGNAHIFLSDDEDDIFSPKFQSKKPTVVESNSKDSNINLAGSLFAGVDDDDDLFAGSSEKVEVKPEGASDSIMLPPTVTEDKLKSSNSPLNNSMFKDRAKLGAQRKKRNPTRKAVSPANPDNVTNDLSTEEPVASKVESVENSTSSTAVNNVAFSSSVHETSDGDSEDDLFGRSSKNSKRRTSALKISKKSSLESKSLFDDTEDFDLFNPSSKVSRKNSKLKMFAGDETDIFTPTSKRNGDPSTLSDPSDDDLFTRK